VLPQAWSVGTIGWFGILPTVLASLALIGIAAAIVFAVRQSSKQNRTVDGGDPPPEEKELSPREILQIRYVCGEITRDQYYEMLADLN
jgi:uncharacterized membrane protein